MTSSEATNYSVFTYTMAFRIITRVAAVFFALFILFASLIESSSIKYAYGARDLLNPRPSPQVNVTYGLPHPGGVLPGSPLWTAKAFRDKVSLELTQNLVEKSRLELHLADKRLAAANQLWLQDNSVEAIATFAKAETYLASSYETLSQSEDPNNNDALRQLAYSSLKHREILENVMGGCGDDARPTISKMMSTSKMLYEKVSAQMENLRMNPPLNPF